MRRNRTRFISVALGAMLAGGSLCGGTAWAGGVTHTTVSGFIVQAWPDTWVKSSDGYANVRNGPGTSYQIVGVLKSGTQVGIIEKGEKWTKTTAGGWVANSLLTTTKPVTSVGTTTVGAPQDSVSTQKTTTTLNIRSTPSISGKVVGTIPKGASATVTGAVSNGWYPVSYKSVKGWASAKYLTATGAKTATAAPTPTTTAPKGTGNYAYATTSLNMRFGPKCDSGVVTVLPKGAKVYVQDTMNGWYNVQYGSKIGWASGRYLDGDQITTKPEPACTK